MEQKEFAKHLRCNMTESENKLWLHLRAHRLNGEKFRCQQPIGPYVVDFVHFGARLIVEADGGQHNDSHHDEKRDTWLREQGFKVMRFWNNDITGNLDGVLATVLAATTESPLSPAPPGETTSHSTRLQTTTARSLVIPQGARGEIAARPPRSDAFDRGGLPGINVSHDARQTRSARRKAICPHNPPRHAMKNG